MTINADVLNALNPVLANTWAVELPEQPSFPAIVFDVDTEVEQHWPVTVVYEQHTVAVVILARARTEISALLPQIDTAMASMAGYLRDDARGDASYEDDASVYAYFANYIIRRRRG